MQTVWAYVFITSRHPKRLLSRVRNVAGVIHADALFGTPDIIAIVAGGDIKLMDEVIDRIADFEDVTGLETKIARWLDGIGPPKQGGAAA